MQTPSPDSCARNVQGNNEASRNGDSILGKLGQVAAIQFRVTDWKRRIVADSIVINDKSVCSVLQYVNEPTVNQLRMMWVKDTEEWVRRELTCVPRRSEVEMNRLYQEKRCELLQMAEKMTARGKARALARTIQSGPLALAPKRTIKESNSLTRQRGRKPNIFL